ncbi:protein FAM124A-like isoform X1 [Xenopus laevis]|uniref:Protein FAM124A-like isoform X1 n=1 Tax=Xenopus laevis TaxID=8355 RepID=A0A8J0UE07_XENLA|nr:protein FAM124A-like isoform X1 [Xenopus laevis]
MDRKAGEDDWEDSGAETGGSDYSRLSSTSSEQSVEDIQDPFLVSIHIIADPGESKCLQEAIDRLLAWIHPNLQLFCVSERRVSKKRKPSKSFASHPALAVILFLQEAYGEDQILHLHKCFQKPPWQFHHTERVHGKFLPYMPCNQDFFTLASGTPMWAIRQVHYGKEIIRFTVYSSYENFADMMKMYELILKKRVWRKKTDFCVFTVYSNMDFDIEFSLKRLVKGQKPVPLESSLLEFRVRDFGQLIPLLPNQCIPISEGRWKTEDHDGNKILLQAQYLARKTIWKHQNYFSRNPAMTQPLCIAPHNRKFKSGKHKGCSGTGQVQHFGSQMDFPRGQMDTFRSLKAPSETAQAFQRSKSLYCLPTTSTFLSWDSLPMIEPHPSFGQDMYETPVWRISPKVNIDDLEGVEETDVDTGMKLSSSDLSVVSAYSPLNGLCSDLEASLPSHGALSHSDTLPGRQNRSYDSLHSISDLSSSSCSVFPRAPGASTLTQTQGPILSHYRQSSEITSHLSEMLNGEEEFYI